MIKAAKSAIFFLIGISLIGVLASCGENQEQPQAKPKKKVEQQTEEPELIDAFSRSAIAYTSTVADTHPDKNSTSASDVPEETVQVEAARLYPVSAKEAADRTQIRKNKRSTWEVLTKTPAGSLADQVMKNTASTENARYVWTPQPVSGSLQLFRVPDVKLSPDTSLLVFLETIGAAQGPFGSRLILMNTSTWQVINILELRDRYIQKFAFIPGTTKIAALCLAQPARKQEQGFSCIDLLTGKEERFQQIEPGIGDTAFLVDSYKNLIVSHPERSSMILLPLESKQHQEINVNAPNSIAALSPDGRELAVFDPKHGKKIEVFHVEDGRPIATVDVSGVTIASTLHFARGNKSFFICGSPSHSSRAALIRAGKATVQDGVSTGNAVFTGNGKTIYHLTHGNEIRVLDGVTGTELRMIEVNKAQPGFRKARPGAVTHLFYIPACNGLAMFDDRGHLFLIPAESQKDTRGKHEERAIIFQNQPDN